MPSRARWITLVALAAVVAVAAAVVAVQAPSTPSPAASADQASTARPGTTVPEGLRTPDDGTGPIGVAQADPAPPEAGPVPALPAVQGSTGLDGVPTPPGATDPGPPATPFVADELLVRFDPSTTEADRAAARRRHGLTKLEDLALPGLERVRIDAPARPAGAQDPHSQAATLERDGIVRYAEPNYLWRATAAPNDPGYADLWGFDNDGTFSASAVVDADGDVTEGFDRAADTSGIVVAVIDEGVDATHADLADNMWVNAAEAGGTAGVDDDGNGFVDDIHGWDFVHNDASVYDAADGDDHGTHVAGTIAAVSNNGTGVAGVSQARIMALKFLGADGTGSTADAIEAIDYAIANGAHIANNSWGGSGASAALAEKIQAASEAGMLFVAAAGNGGSDNVGDDNDVTPHYPSSYTNPNVLAVAATTVSDGRAAFSNYGLASVDIGAPGKDILSAVPGRNAKAVASTYGSGASVLHSFGLEGVADAGDAAAIVGAALQQTGVAPGAGSSILLVRDNGNWPYEATYTSALATAGYTSVTTAYVNYECTNDGPNPTGYDAVVWFTGQRSTCTLTANDQASLTTYVNGGGALVLFGQSIAQNLNGTTLLSAVLGVDYVASTDYDFGPAGADGTAYAGTAAKLITPPDTRSHVFSDALSPRAGATAVMVGTGPLSFYQGTSMATPFVTGVAANVLAAFPGMRAAHIKERIMATGDANAALAGATVSGRRANLNTALATGTLSGTVTAATGGGALSGICVTAWSNPTGAYSRSTTTDATGAYSLTLPTDDYTVQFRDCRTNPAYAMEFNGNAADWPAAQAAPVTVADGGTATADAALAGAGTMAGTVRDSGGGPLSGICVNAFTSSGTWVGSTRTPAAGTWTIGGFGTGSYQVRFTDCTRTGAAQHATQWHDGSPDRGASYALVSVTAGAPTTGIDAAMELTGFISGTVTAAAGGAPIASVCVSATTPDGLFIQRVTTAANGTYTVGGMGSGSFKLFFSDCTGLGYTPEWWNDAPTGDTATTIAVVSGLTTTGNNAALS